MLPLSPTVLTTTGQLIQSVIIHRRIHQLSFDHCEVKFSTERFYKKPTCYIVLPLYQSVILPPSVEYRYCFIDPNKRRSWTVRSRIVLCVIFVSVVLSCNHTQGPDYRGQHPHHSATVAMANDGRRKFISYSMNWLNLTTRTSIWGTYVLFNNIILDIRTRQIVSIV